MGTTFFYPYKKPRWDQYVLDSLNQCMAAAEEAGTGTARVMGGTQAEREAYATPYNGLLWTETDTGYVWVYWDSAWHCLSKKAETDAAIADARRGRMTGYVDYETPSTLTIHSGIYEVDGVPYELASNISAWSPGTLSANTIYYVYLDPPGSGTALDSSNFSSSTSAPTYDAAKGGLYDASARRCVGVFKTDGSGNIIPFRITADGQKYSYGDAQSAIYTTTPPATLTAASLGLPALGRLNVHLIGKITQASTSVYLYVANGHTSVGSGGTPTDSMHILDALYSSTESGTLRSEGQGEAVTDTAGQILYAANGGTVQISVKGFDLPLGLRRTN